MVRAQVTDIVAEMVAAVLEVEVEVGAEVAVGDPIVLLESMKMEIPLCTEVSGIVSAVKVSTGDVVQEGDVIAQVTPG